jgi:hypothetical protein
VFTRALRETFGHALWLGRETGHNEVVISLREMSARALLARIAIKPQQAQRGRRVSRLID